MWVRKLLILRGESFERKSISHINKVNSILVSEHKIRHDFKVKPGNHAHTQWIIFLLNVINLLDYTLCLSVNDVNLTIFIKAGSNLLILDLDGGLDILSNEVGFSFIQCNACCLVVLLNITEEQTLRRGNHDFVRIGSL